MVSENEQNNNLDLTFPESYLKKVVDLTASALVGKILKRFEIHDDPKIIKAEVKELIYEQFRHLKELLMTYTTAREVTVWKFNSKQPTRPSK